MYIVHSFMVKSYVVGGGDGGGDGGGPWDYIVSFLGQLISIVI